MTSRSSPLPLLVSLLFAGLLAMAGTGAVHAQSGMRSVRAVGTGGGSSVLDTGPAALYSNPANLTVGPQEHSLEVQLLRIGTYAGGDFYQFDRSDPLFFDTEEALSSDEQKAILDEWFDSGQRNADTYLEVVPLSVTYRPSDASWAAGFGIRGRAFQTSALNKGVFDVLLRGTNPDRTVPVNGRTRVYSTIDFTGSFSYRLSSLPLSVGISPRIILGAGHADGTLDSRVTVSGDSLTHRFNYTARASGALSTGLLDTFDAFSSDLSEDVFEGSTGIAGTGVGIDIGATYTVRPNLHVSASITDLGFVNWNTDAQTVTPSDNSFRFEGVTLDLDRLENEFDDDIGEYVTDQVDSLAQEAYQYVERDRSSYTTGLPTTLHLNGTWEPVSLVTLNGGLSVGLNEEAGAVPDPAALHLGSTLHLGPFPIRAGVRLLGTQAATLSGGFGIHLGFYRLDVGVSLTPSTSTLGSGARYAASVSLATIRF